MYCNLVSLVSSSARCMAIISASSTVLPPTCVSRQLNRRYSTCCRLDENGCILVISVSVFPFPPESSLSYIRMVVLPKGRCRRFVVVLIPPIVLMRVGDLPAA